MPQLGEKRKKRRTIEKDFQFYDGPDVIWDKINGDPWPYKTHQEFYETRDRAYMSLSYLTVCRVSELCRADLKGAGYKPSIRKNQFYYNEEGLNLRGVIILKRRELVNGEWVAIRDLSHYPLRKEIHLPLIGGLSRFTELIIEYLNMLTNDRDELFKFRRSRAYQIVNHCTKMTEEEEKEEDRGIMPHYFRDMGLKLYARVLDRNIKDLMEFSGHAQVETLMKYLGEGQLKKKLQEWED